AYGHKNKGGLWQALKQMPQHQPIIDYLHQFLTLSRNATPYALFAKMLAHPCPASVRSGLSAMIARLGHDALDPLDEFLNLALNFETRETPSVQNFLHWLSLSDIEIKRELQ